MAQWVLIVQCDDIRRRCAGFLCTRDFYKKQGMFAGYPEDARYMTLSCGGCPGQGLARVLEHLSRRLAEEKISKEDTVLHFASCMVSDNHHHGPCPFVKEMFRIAARHGFSCLTAGTYISRTSERKRESGEYRPWIVPEKKE